MLGGDSEAEAPHITLMSVVPNGIAEWHGVGTNERAIVDMMDEESGVEAEAMGVGDVEVDREDPFAESDAEAAVVAAVAVEGLELMRAPGTLT
eukprot:353641-Prymnesium_polylepis.1